MSASELGVGDAASRNGRGQATPLTNDATVRSGFATPGSGGIVPSTTRGGMVAPSTSPTTAGSPSWFVSPSVNRMW